MAKKTPVRVIKQPDQKELDAILKELVKKARVKVGFPRGSGAYPDGTSVVEVAIYNEFGTRNIPPRPFIRPAINNGKAYYKKLGQAIAKDVIKRRTTLEAGLRELGLTAVTDIQDEITNLKEPALADSTIERKGSDKPLIDTGHLRQSVTYQVMK